MDLLESDRKILVFAHHQVVLDALEEAVTAKVRGQQLLSSRLFKAACITAICFVVFT